MADIVKIADSFVEEIMAIINELDNINNIRDAFNGNGSIGRTQLDLLLRAIRKANSVEEVKLFISYQSAKSRRNESWDKTISGRKISDIVIEKINKILDLASENSLTGKGFTFEDLSSDDIRNLKLKLCEKFLGYFYWKGTVYSKN